MKLHLPKKLTAALLAACAALALNTTAAAATGTATFGDTVTLNRGDEVFNGLYVTQDMTTGTATTNAVTLDNNVNIRGGNFFAKDYTVSIWVTMDSLASSQLLFAYGSTNPTSTPNPQANGIYWNAEDKTITVGRGNVSGYTSMSWYGSDYKTTGSLESALGSGSMVNFTIAVKGGDQNSNPPTPTVWVNGVSVVTLDSYKGNMNGDTNQMRYYVGSNVTYGNVSITDTQYTDRDDIISLMGLSKEAPPTAFNYVWTGSTDGKWDTATENWVTKEATTTPVAFQSGDDNTVTLNATGQLKEISLETAANISKLTAEDTYKVTIAQASSLTTATLAVSGTLTIDGDGTATIGTLNNTGTLNLGAAATVASAHSLGTVNVSSNVAFTNALALTSAASPAAAAIHVKDSGVLTISSTSTIGGASLNSENSAAFTNLFQGKAVDVQGTGKLVIDGGINTVDRNQGNQAYASGLSNLEILGNAKINTWAATNTTYNLGNHSIKTTGDLWLVTKQTLNISEGGNLEVGGKLKLGHDSNAKGGTNSSHLVTTDATISLGGIGMYGGNNSVSITGGDLTFNTASATDNVLSKAGGGDLASDPVTFTGVTLHSGTHGWTLAPVQEAAVNLAGVTTLDVDADKPITLTAGIDGTITKIGAGTATVNGTGSLSDTIKVNVGKLVLTGTYAIDHVATGTTTESYIGPNGQPSENGGFFKQSGTKTVYTVATGGGAELNRDSAIFTYNNENVTALVNNGTFMIPDDAPPAFDTLFVKKNTLSFAEHKAYAGQHGGSITSVQLANATTVDMDEAASITLALENGANATVNATAATTISSLAGTGATLNITGNNVVTLAAASSMTSAINIGAADGSSSVTVKLNNGQALGAADNAITVYKGATLDVNGKDAPGAGLLYTVTLAGGTLANNGAIVSYGSRQLISHLVVSADSTVDAANKDFGVINADYNPTKIELNANLEKVGSNGFHICNATFSGTGKLIISDGTLSIDKAKNNSSTFANDIDMNGGTLDGAFKLAGAITITATDEGSAITANIKNEGNNITFAGDNDLTMRGVISGNGGLTKNDEGTLTLNGAQTYTGATVVNSGKLVVNGTIASQEVTLGENASIENNGTGAITLSDVDEHLMQVENTGAGELTLKNASGMLSVVELTIAADSTVSFYDKAETPAEGTITVTETLTAGGGTLLANLTVQGGATLDVAGGGEMALTLGSTLTMDTTTGLINLDDATLAALDALDLGERLTLVKALDQTTLAYGADDYAGTWYGQMFNRTDALVGDFQVFATETGFGLTKVSNTPEPTTGTLSLLALMALAVRRRRK